MRIISLHNGHDASITAFEDGEILGHWELERVLNIKHFCGVDHRNEIADVLYDHVLPRLKWAAEDIDQVVFAGKSEWDKTEFHTFVPQYENFDMEKPYATGFVSLRGNVIKPCVSVVHHLNHMAYAYYTSPFTEATLFSYDGIGDGTSAMAGHGVGNKISVRYIFSKNAFGALGNNGIGLCYSYLGRLFPFLGSDLLATAGKAMGLSSYGEAYTEENHPKVYDICWEMITEWMPDPGKWKQALTDELPGINWNDPMCHLVQNLMATIQQCLEDYVCDTVLNLCLEFKCRNVAMAGGCALNVQANTELYKRDVVDALYVPPATSDCGVSIGAGLYVWHHVLGNSFGGMSWHDPYKGDPLYNAPPPWTATLTRMYRPIDRERDEFVKWFNKEYPELQATIAYNEKNMLFEVGHLLADGKIIAWAQGRCEIGPRALGNRSILSSAAPTQDDWLDVWREGKGTFKETINDAIKHREFWRPFAPIGLLEDSKEYFEIDHEQPYMLEAPMARDWPVKLGPNGGPSLEDGTPLKAIPLWHKLAAVIHVDGTGRIQTVTEENNRLMHALLTEYKRHTGVGILLNTSLNDAGIPINNRLEDILNLLRDTEVDYAVVGNWIFNRRSDDS